MDMMLEQFKTIFDRPEKVKKLREMILNLAVRGKLVEQDYNDEPTIVIGRVGFYCGSIHLTENKAWITDNAFITNYPKNHIYQEYLVWLLKGTNLKEEENATAQPVISGRKVYPVVVGIPPLQEQKCIVEKVDSLMAFCDKLEESLEKKVHYGSLSAKSVFNSIGNATTTEELEETLRFILCNFKDLSLGDNAVKELKNCIFQLAVQGKLVPQDPSDEPAKVLLEKIRDEKERLIKEKKIKKEKPLAEISEDEKPYELPKGWKWVRLKEIGYNLGQKKPDRSFTYIDVGSINKEKGLLGEDLNIVEPRDAPSRARKLVDKGTVIYSTVRPYLLNIAIIDREFEFEPIVSTAFAVIHPYNGVNERFILTYLRSVPFINYVESQMVGMAYPAINDEKLFNGLFPIPPLVEQKRIVEKVDSLMQLCDKLEKKIEKSKNYSNRLMESILKSSFLA